MDELTTPEFSVRLIKLADGTLIDPSTREPLVSFQPPKPSSVSGDPDEEDALEVEDDDVVLDSLAVVPTQRRSVMDLALSPQQMAVVNNVLVYTLWGLPDDEIGMQCNCDIHQVHIIRDLDDYKRMHDSLIEGLRNSFMGTVQGIMADAAPRAARGMIAKMKNKSQDISIAAMKDILDRSGHRPADRVEHTHNIGNGSELVIRVIRQNDEDRIPKMDLTPNA